MWTKAQDWNPQKKGRYLVAFSKQCSVRVGLANWLGNSWQYNSVEFWMEIPLTPEDGGEVQNNFCGA